MIPKVIHYCWFGGKEKPQDVLKCIESWKKYLPDYEIKEWNENNFNIYIIPYTEEAYRLKKYAFVSDYARFWILYNYGGLYFDTDVEIIKPLYDIIAKGAFMGLEKTENSSTDSLTIAPGLGLGCTPNNHFYKEILDFYHKQHYISWTGKMTGTVVAFTSQLIHNKNKEIKENGVICCEGINIYPTDYFDPLNYYTQELTITENTRTIHHYSASWINCSSTNYFNRIRRKLYRILIRIFVQLRRKIAK